ncbi:Tetratricopeptide repeat (TPR)-like superfamily protein [Forsythia ovata]|uniref:Tetratricopeptide repeat (TPR)-like superfamily protein n=1 Tax=Forsythia ovata TaxID=205694 RepID=A0ABD1PJI5_9LAMI
MVDPANTTLGRMLLDEISPVVMVLRTPLVEESCRKNGLSFIEMLSPFCNFNNIDVPVRTASDQPYRLRKFRLRLFYASEIRQPNIEVAKERLKQVITHAGEKDLLELSSDPPQIETVLATSELEFLPSWFQYFNKELVGAASFAEHEAFDHPVACLLAVSSKDEDPVNKFVDLFNMNQLPSLLNDGAMDSKIPKHFLLVHDNQDSLSEKATRILTEMRSTFGVNDCRLICINSSADGFGEHQENPWASSKNSHSHNQQQGCFLNVDDIDELRNAMQDLSSKHIIPHMELKIRMLNQQVSATRKGFKNQIKNLWWRKGKEDGPDNPNGPTYTFSSIETQIRVLGDHAFMLRDYELALSNYRLISTDYKLDKAWKHYAGVQEMMGLSYFMLDQSRKDAEYCMENAFSTYLKIGSSGLQNATRCGLWWAEMLKARDQYKDAAGVYFRISGEEPLHSAVMLEQASYCYLFSSPPMLRKYGFHLVLSGDLYKKCDQIKHAIRTYRGALSVFNGTAWNRIRDHVHFHIGKWYAFLGISDEAIKHMLEVLACGHQSKTTQELFLRDFFQIVQKTGKTFEVSRLQLPMINISSFRVVFEDHRTYASSSAASVRENLWWSLEEDMVPSLSVMKTNWLDQPKILPKKYRESNVCVAGEAIKVNVGFRNPLQIPISISSVSLICEHYASSDEKDSDASSSIIDHHNDEESSKLSVSRDFSVDTSLFNLSEIEITLEGGETTVVQLTVTPKIEGTLKIVGVRWKLSGLVVGLCNFESDMIRKKIAKGKRKSKKSMKDNLKFLVIKSLPRLEGVIHHLPRTVYAGDLRRLTLELRNLSETSVKNLKMNVNNPRFLNAADQDVVNMEFPACLEKQANSTRSSVQVETSKSSSSIFQFPENAAISGEKAFMWPLWFRAAAPGNISLYITIYYEVEDLSAVIRYRTLRMHYNLEVLPSLEVSFKISPRPSRLQEFLVRMDVVNKTSSESFQVHQLSSVGDEWEIALLEPIDAIPLEFLMAGQVLSCFFKLKNCRDRLNAENEICSTSKKADVRLGNGHMGGFFDISSSPLTMFHHYERLHEEMLDREHQNTVDFILISQTQSDSNPEWPNSIKVFSHHTCHCSIASRSPIWWLMESPRTVKHDFSTTFCEINLSMTVRNSSEDDMSVSINTIDSTTTINSVSSPAPVSGNEVGWHDLSHLTEIKVTSDVLGAQVAKSLSPESVSPFIWSGASSTRFELKSLSSAEIPLQICVFTPGTYDLSNYSLHWNLLSSSDKRDNLNESGPSSGTCQGYPYYITVLQKD